MFLQTQEYCENTEKMPPQVSTAYSCPVDAKELANVFSMRR